MWLPARFGSTRQLARHGQEASCSSTRPPLPWECPCLRLSTRIAPGKFAPSSAEKAGTSSTSRSWLRLGRIPRSAGCPTLRYCMTRHWHVDYLFSTPSPASCLKLRRISTGAPIAYRFATQTPPLKKPCELNPLSSPGLTQPLLLGLCMKTKDTGPLPRHLKAGTRGAQEERAHDVEDLVGALQDGELTMA